MLRDKLHEQSARGFRAIKMGWRPFGRVSRKLDELLIKTARETVGDDVELMVDAGGSEQFWPHGVSWARETARMLGDYGVIWFEEALRARRRRRLRELRAVVAGADRHRRSAHAAAVVSAVHRRAGRRHHSARPDQVRRPERRRGGWPGWPTITACCWCRTAGTRPSAWRPTWPCRPRMPVARWVEYQTGVPYIEEIIDAAASSSTPTACCACRPARAWELSLNPDAMGKYARR